MLCPLIFALLTFIQPSGGPREFRQIKKSPSIRTVFELPDLCEGDCWEDFLQTGDVWAGDINDDGKDELIISPGRGWRGTGGDWYFLFAKENGHWMPIDVDERSDGSTILNNGWQTNSARFDILPTVRGGYHDLRIEVDHCLKWNGRRYVDFQPDDYANLSVEWFKQNVTYEAEIFWKIRQVRAKDNIFDPLWIQLGSKIGSNSVNMQLDDPESGIRWVAFFKGGVWGVKGNRGFLLLPHPAYTGAHKLEIEGEWLLIYGEAGENWSLELVARYNRKTHLLLITPD